MIIGAINFVCPVLDHAQTVLLKLTNQKYTPSYVFPRPHSYLRSFRERLEPSKHAAWDRINPAAYPENLRCLGRRLQPVEKPARRNMHVAVPQWTVQEGRSSHDDVARAVHEIYCHAAEDKTLDNQ